MFSALPVAFALAALAIGLGWRPWSGRPARRAGDGFGGEPSAETPSPGAPGSGPWATALAGALIPLTVYTVNSQGKLPPWPPVRWQNMLWVALPMVAVAIMAGRSLRLATASFATLAAASFWQALGPYRKHQWAESNELWIWLPALTLVASCLFVIHGRDRQQSTRGVQGPLLLTVVLAAAAKIIGDSGSGSSAMIAIGLCFLSGGLLVLALWRRDLPVLRGSAAHFTWIPMALLVQVKFYASLELGPALCLVGALGAAGLPAQSRFTAVLRALVVLALVGLAVQLAWPEPDPMGY